MEEAEGLVVQVGQDWSMVELVEMVAGRVEVVAVLTLMAPAGTVVTAKKGHIYLRRLYHG